jgi:hypothetical protein
MAINNLGSSGRFSVFFRAAWVMEWSRKSYTRSYWLPGTKYGTNRALLGFVHRVSVARSSSFLVAIGVTS